MKYDVKLTWWILKTSGEIKLDWSYMQYMVPYSVNIKNVCVSLKNLKLLDL